MNHEKAIQQYKNSLSERLGDNLINAKLFGSVARGTDLPESDIDILVLVRTKDRATKDSVFDTAVEINLAYDVVIVPIIMKEEEYQFPIFKESGFFRTIDQEGILL